MWNLKLKKYKKNILLKLLLLACSSFSIVSLTTSVKFFSNNKTESLVEISKQINESDDVSGIIFPYKLAVSVYDYNVYHNVENIKEIRNLYPEFTIFNVYQRHFRSKYFSPGSYIENNIENDVSIILMPKNIDDGTFSYSQSIPLLTRPLSRAELMYPGSNDIFINQSYADFLKETYQITNYSDLIDKSFPLLSKHESGSITDMCVVKGVIDSSSDFYLKYKKKFGDFFVANEFYTVNQSALTYFEIPSDSQNNIYYFQIIEKLYNYKTKILSYSNTNKTFLYEYRISLYPKEIFNEELLLQSGKKENEYDIKCMRIYDSFLYNVNIIYLLLFLLLGIIGLSLSIFIVQKLIKRNDETITFFVLLSIFLIPINVLLAQGINLLFNIDPWLTMHNYITFIVLAIYALIIGASLYMLKKRAKTNPLTK